MSEPLTLEFEWMLHDGTHLLVRPIRADDKDRLQDALPKISAENLYRRFFMPVVRLSEEQLRFLTEVDQVTHIAWCAVAVEEPGEPLTGVCRCVHGKEEEGVAEAAILVVDDYQNRGIGTLLLAVLCVIAAHHGIRTLRSFALEENTPFLDTMKSLGAGSKWEYSNVRRIDLPVYDDPSAVPTSSRGQIFRCVLNAVRLLVKPSH